MDGQSNRVTLMLTGSFLRPREQSKFLLIPLLFMNRRDQLDFIAALAKALCHQFGFADVTTGVVHDPHFMVRDRAFVPLVEHRTGLLNKYLDGRFFVGAFRSSVGKRADDKKLRLVKRLRAREQQLIAATVVDSDAGMLARIDADDDWF